MSTDYREIHKMDDLSDNLFQIPEFFTLLQPQSVAEYILARRSLLTPTTTNGGFFKPSSTKPWKYPPTCEELAWGRFNAKANVLNTNYNAAEQPLLRKYTRDLVLCERTLIAELAALAALNALEIAGCNALTAPPAVTQCYHAVIAQDAIASGLIYYHFETCHDSARIDYDASHDPIYKKYCQDYNEAWATLGDEIDVCTRIRNGGN